MKCVLKQYSFDFKVDEYVFTIALGNDNTSNPILNCSRCVRWNYYGGCTLKSSCVFCNTTFPCKSRNQTCATDINICVNDYTAFYNGKSKWYISSRWILLAQNEAYT